MKKKQISRLLRRFKLIYLADWLHFWFQKHKNRKLNSNFKKDNPDVQLPPDYLIYEAFQMNYDLYYNGGLKMAKWLKNHFKNHIGLNDKRILDWGCGPGRIIRHMPEVINTNCEFFATDYNEKSIDWCSKNIEGIAFNKNELKASLPYETSSMDIIYGNSIFTHLSEQMHYDWFEELHRVLKPSGIMLITTQGDNARDKLTQSEYEQYNKGNIVVRGNVKEGHRTYSAFHPKAFMESLFKDADILEHIIQVSEDKNWIPQDIWIISKRT